MQIGSAIKEIRKSNNISQKELASLCGISQTYLSLVEHGKKIPKLETLSSISIKLGTSLHVVLLKAIEETEILPNKRELFEQLKPIIENAYEATLVKDYPANLPVIGTEEHRSITS
jgi:XRE family transcriptional regulator, regulator of sulfur utilization